MSWVAAIGYLASALVFATFCMRTMIPLRVAAICSNVAFITYGHVGGIYPVMILHCLLLPMNLWRTREMMMLVGKVRAAAEGGGALDWLLPYMKHRRCAAGEVLFRKEDAADRMFVVLKGEVVLEESGVRLGAGALLGEMALFSDAGRRTQTARCAEAAEFGWIGKAALAQLCYQNPAISFHLLGLVTNRLMENVARVEARDDAVRAAD